MTTSQVELQEQIEKAVWTLMVGCASGNIAPDDKDMQVGLFIALFRSLGEEINKSVLNEIMDKTGDEHSVAFMFNDLAKKRLNELLSIKKEE